MAFGSAEDAGMTRICFASVDHNGILRLFFLHHVSGSSLYCTILVLRITFYLPVDHDNDIGGKTQTPSKMFIERIWVTNGSWFHGIDPWPDQTRPNKIADPVTPWPVTGWPSSISAQNVFCRKIYGLLDNDHNRAYVHSYRSRRPNVNSPSKFN